MDQEAQRENENQLSLQTLFVEAKNSWLLIIIVTLLFALVGGIYAQFFVDVTYTSKASFVVNVMPDETAGNTTTAYSYAVNLTNTLGPYIKTTNVCKKALDIYNDSHEEKLSSYNEIQKAISYSVTDKSFIISLTCATANPDADGILQAAMEAAIDVAQEYQEGQTFLANKLLIYEQPSKPSDNEISKLYKYILIFFVLGLVVSGVIVLLKVILNDTYKSKESLESDIPVEVLALIDDLAEAKEGK